LSDDENYPQTRGSGVPSLSQLFSNDKPQTRPDLIDGGDLVIHHPGRQEEIAQAIFGDVGRHLGCPLGPRTPDGTVGGKACHRLKESPLEVSRFAGEDYDDLRGASVGRSVLTLAEFGGEGGRGIDQQQMGGGPDS